MFVWWKVNCYPHRIMDTVKYALSRSPFEVGYRKEFALKDSKLFPYRQAMLGKGANTFWSMISLNPFMPSGLFYLNSLDRFISYIGVSG